MEKLSSFSHKEVQMILCGNQSPSWTAEDIVNYTEPKLGYTRDRYIEIHLANIIIFTMTLGLVQQTGLYLIALDINKNYLFNTFCSLI